MGDVILMIVVSLVVMPVFRRLLGSLFRSVTGSGQTATGVSKQSVQMERDPVCGTFVVPSTAVTLADGSRRLYFCSTTCRDSYRTRSSPGSGRREPVEGRTA